MLTSGKHGLNKRTHAKAIREHHFLGSLIKGLGMAAKFAAPALKVGLKAAPGLLSAGAGIHQMRQQNKANKAQERLMNAQAEGAEDQNKYLKKQMAEPQTQKKGGRTQSRKRYC